MGLIDELKKTGSLQGEELDAALLGINEKEKSIFNKALQDIAKQIGALSIG